MILTNSKRPLIIYGWGIHLAKAEKEAIAYSHGLGVPVVCTWGAADLFKQDDPLYIGTFGTHGSRAANFAVQNADIILSIGSRLDTKATGSPASDFAKKAEVYMVDIDQGEIDKFKILGRKINGICQDAKEFFKERVWPISQNWENQRVSWVNGERGDWIRRIAGWKAKYPAYDPTYKIGEGINPYEFIYNLSDYLNSDDIIVSDTGCPVGWVATTFRFNGQRLFHGWNNTPMGYGLPASIGAAFASGRRIICITGDGGLAVNITELATLARHNLPVKIILFNNRGHAMCRQTQRTWLGGTYPSTSYEGGLATPDYESVADAYGIRTHESVQSLLADAAPGFIELNIHEDYQIVPQVRFGKPLEDADPEIPREDIVEIMK
jgi:acetolactate synthase-1/2/3 large subunit